MWFAIMFLLLCSQARAEHLDVKTQRKEHYDRLSEPFFGQFMEEAGYTYGQPVEVKEGVHPYLALLIDDNIPGSFQDRAASACVLIAPKTLICNTGPWPHPYNYRILMNHKVDEDTPPLEVLGAPLLFEDWREDGVQTQQNLMVFTLKRPVRFNRQRSLITFHQRYSQTPFLADDHQNWDPTWFLLKQATWIVSDGGFVRAEVPMTLAPAEGNPASVHAGSTKYTYIVEQLSRKDPTDQYYLTHRWDLAAPLLVGFGSSALRTQAKGVRSRYGLALSFVDNLYDKIGNAEYDQKFFVMPVDSYNLVAEENERSTRKIRRTGPSVSRDLAKKEEESYRYDEIKKRDCDYSLA